MTLDAAADLGYRTEDGRTPERILRGDLNLGATVDDIYRTLDADGHIAEAEPGSCYRCPIALHLYAQGWAEVEVCDKRIRVFSWTTGWVQIDTPPLIAEFIDGFDTHGNFAAVAW